MHSHVSGFISINAPKSATAAAAAEAPDVTEISAHAVDIICGDLNFLFAVRGKHGYELTEPFAVACASSAHFTEMPLLHAQPPSALSTEAGAKERQ